MEVWRYLAISSLLALFSVDQCSGYSCYICSWSPASPNRTDICTTKNFNKDAVQVFNKCPHGCETVSVFDQNGDLENFYRNCLVKGKEVTNDCQIKDNAALKKEICRCDSDLCNDGAHTTPALLFTLAAAAAAIRLKVLG